MHAVFTKTLSTRQANAIGETLTLGSIYTPAPSYTKPVLILNGQKDFFYCQGNCLAEGGDLTADALTTFYPNRNVEKSKAITVPDVGHNIHLHLARGEVFEKMLKFIKEAGIEP